MGKLQSPTQSTIRHGSSPSYSNHRLHNLRFVLRFAGDDYGRESREKMEHRHDILLLARFVVRLDNILVQDIVLMAQVRNLLGVFIRETPQTCTIQMRPLAC